METAWLWIPITFSAALSQTVRTASQKYLTKDLTAMSATLVRFLFGLPFVAGYLWFLMAGHDRTLPDLSLPFLVSCLAASLSQIIATFLLVYSFSLRNFAVGTTYARTEAFQTAVVGAIFFGELIVVMGWIAIGISVIGVVLISAARAGLDAGGLTRSDGMRSALVGLASGTGFAFASLFIRQASLSFGNPDFLFTAAVTLVTMVVMQTVITGVYVGLTDRRQFALIVKNWRFAILVGLTSAIGSGCWFTAMTLEKASYVKALGQVEFLFTLFASTYVFREASSRKELVGMVLVVVGIVVLLTAG